MQNVEFLTLSTSFSHRYMEIVKNKNYGKKVRFFPVWDEKSFSPELYVFFKYYACQKVFCYAEPLLLFFFGGFCD